RFPLCRPRSLSARRPCSTPPGTTKAACTQHRPPQGGVMRMHGIVVAAAAAAALVFAATDAGAQAQSAAQQQCLNGMTAALAKLAKTQQKAIADCLKAASVGALPAGQTAEQCLTADGKGA